MQKAVVMDERAEAGLSQDNAAAGMNSLINAKTVSLMSKRVKRIAVIRNADGLYQRSDRLQLLSRTG